MRVDCVRIVVLLFALLPCCALGDTYVTGTVFGLPPDVKPITDVEVEVRLFRPQFDPARQGELLRDGSGNLVPEGTEVSSAVTDIKTGAYRLPASLARDEIGVFIIRFNRKLQAVTQDISGVVLKDKVPVQLDVVVPIPQNLGCGACSGFVRKRFFRCR